MIHNECGKVAVSLDVDDAFDWLFEGPKRACMSCGATVVGWGSGFGGVDPMVYS